MEYSEDTAHTVEVIREENEHGELGSFGFTLLYEKPPIVGTIVPGELKGLGGEWWSICVCWSHATPLVYCKLELYSFRDML